MPGQKSKPLSKKKKKRVGGHKVKTLEKWMKQLYPREKLKAAVRDVLNGVFTVIGAAKFHKIPVQTIRDNVK